MTNVDPVGGGAAGPMSVGETLRAAREAQGLSIDDISTRTRVPVRHLEAVEASDFKALPSPTYAVGFSRAYARAVGLSDSQIAAQVRTEVNRIGPRKPEYMPQEVADPARVPGRGIAVVAAGLALALLVLGALWFLSTRFTGAEADGEGTTPANAVVAAVPAAATPAAPPPAQTGGQVSLVATDDVWLRVHDDADRTLFIGNMKAGDRFDVPATANDPKIDVGRPDKLQVTLNGSNVPPLGDGSRPIKDVRVSGAAIAQRLNAAPATGPSPAASATPVAAAAATVPPFFRQSASGGEPKARQPVPPPAPRRQLSETQRANLESAARIRRQQRDR
ncbi:helix-turn-helix domain-containing protein [Sphingomonas lenta]|uniref:helix-turn-helix domain-containing protein n=1 Tax=Sphingomonas lenta TaxID=1141887 RepID=UPI001FE54886|nr:helix-turn-helix domain-containing protein [Sphingomonas lenta]